MGLYVSRVLSALNSLCSFPMISGKNCLGLFGMVEAIIWYFEFSNVIGLYVSISFISLWLQNQNQNALLKGHWQSPYFVTFIGHAEEKIHHQNFS